MKHMNSVLVTGTAAHDFEGEYSSSGAPIVRGTLAGNRARLDAKTKAFYLPVSTVGKAGVSNSLAERLMKAEIKQGTPLILLATFDYRDWMKGDQKHSRVTLRIQSYDFLQDAPTVTDSGGGVRLQNATNQATIVGNLTAQPEMQKTESGDQYVPLRVAINERYKDAQGVWKDQPAQYVSATLWREQAEQFMAQNPTKGSTVLLYGAASNNDWTDKDGNKRKDVVLDDAQGSVLKARPKQESESPQSDKTPREAPARAPSAAPPRRAPLAASADDDTPIDNDIEDDNPF